MWALCCTNCNTSVLPVDPATEAPPSRHSLFCVSRLGKSGPVLTCWKETVSTKTRSITRKEGHKCQDVILNLPCCSTTHDRQRSAKHTRSIRSNLYRRLYSNITTKQPSLQSATFCGWHAANRCCQDTSHHCKFFATILTPKICSILVFCPKLMWKQENMEKHEILVSPAVRIFVRCRWFRAVSSNDATAASELCFSCRRIRFVAQKSHDFRNNFLRVSAKNYFE